MTFFQKEFHFRMRIICMFLSFLEPKFTTLSVVLIVLFIVLIGLVVFLVFYLRKNTSSQRKDEIPIEDSETKNQTSQETDKECKENQENEKILSVLQVLGNIDYSKPNPMFLLTPPRENSFFMGLMKHNILTCTY